MHTWWPAHNLTFPFAFYEEGERLMRAPLQPRDGRWQWRHRLRLLFPVESQLADARNGLGRQTPCLIPPAPCPFTERRLAYSLAEASCAQQFIMAGSTPAAHRHGRLGAHTSFCTVLSSARPRLPIVDA